MTGFAQSLQSAAGLYLLVDVGALTLDVSMFRLNRGAEGDRRYSFMAANVRPLGVESIEWFKTKGERPRTTAIDNAGGRYWMSLSIPRPRRTQLPAFGMASPFPFCSREEAQRTSCTRTPCARSTRDSGHRTTTPMGFAWSRCRRRARLIGPSRLRRRDRQCCRSSFRKVGRRVGPEQPTRRHRRDSTNEGSGGRGAASAAGRGEIRVEGRCVMSASRQDVQVLWG